MNLHSQSAYYYQTVRSGSYQFDGISYFTKGGNDLGVVHPMSREDAVYGADSYDWDLKSKIQHLVSMSNEFTSKSKGEWYNLNLDTVRGTRLVLERVFTKMTSILK
jgi:hypothetical protein